MILNEDYFKDLEIEDEDIIEDDVEEPEHELTLEEAKKIPEQYKYHISFQLYDKDSTDKDITFIQTSLLPRLFKTLDAIFEMYGIEHSEYVLSTWDAEICSTVVKFGDYQLFCFENEKNNIDEYIIDHYLNIHVYVNYPKFTYKRAFRFLYTLLNLYKIGKQIRFMNLPTTDIYLNFIFELYYNIGFCYYNNRTGKKGDEKILGNELTEKDKREFYKSVFCYFFGGEVRVPYKLIDRDVPLKSYIR